MGVLENFLVKTTGSKMVDSGHDEAGGFGFCRLDLEGFVEIPWPRDINSINKETLVTQSVLDEGCQSCH